MIDGVSPVSPAAERMRRYRERRRRGLSCHFDRLVHANGISAVFCIRINHLPTLRTTRPRCKMTFQQGRSGNPYGNRHRTRHLLNQEFMQALLLHFRKDGKKVIEKVARNQPAAYMKICAWLIPKEMKIEHFSTVKGLSDEELESAIATLKAIMAAQASEGARIGGIAESAALPAPEAQSIEAGLEPKRQRRPNRLVMHADTAIGPAASEQVRARRHNNDIPAKEPRNEQICLRQQ